MFIVLLQEHFFQHLPEYVKLITSTEIGQTMLHPTFGGSRGRRTIRIAHQSGLTYHPTGWENIISVSGVADMLSMEV
jgi:hypothetical protein